MELADLSLTELAEKIRTREASVLEVTESALQRLEATEPQISAFVDVYKDDARTRAKELDATENTDRENVLFGIPASLKDVLQLKGKRTTASSKILENYTSSYSATVCQKLEDVGSVFVGKTNCDEFAMGASTENSAYGVTKNPWDLERVPGGSSGGSIASVAVGSSVYSLGSDTGGSIRQPASFCNVVGLKPTYGRVSRYGLIAMASGLDQVSVTARRVEDTAIVLKTISGHDPKDATSSRSDHENFIDAMKQQVNGLRIGIPEEFFGEGLDPEVNALIQAALKQLEAAGAHLVPLSLPHLKYTLPVYYILTPAEVSSNMARYDGIRYGKRSEDAEDLLETYMKTRKEFLGVEVKRRVLIGSYVLSAGYYDAYYKKAQQVRAIIIDEFHKAFEQVDVIASPTSPVPPFKIHERANDPLSMYLSDVYTVAANLAGLPAISVPAGFTTTQLPVGLQFMGAQFEEGKILRAAYAYENMNTWYTKRPPIAGA
jgi:aspartyl-tRNA(Asn)/glutamyl-tRNA(Gln) amidotransferase subunit A